MPTIRLTSLLQHANFREPLLWYDIHAALGGIAVTEAKTVATQLPPSQELIAQLRELETQFPIPTWEDVLPDWKWIHAWMADASLPPARPQQDCWVAVFNQQIVGWGLDPMILQLEKARELGVHPGRLVLTFINGMESW